MAQYYHIEQKSLFLYIFSTTIFFMTMNALLIMIYLSTEWSLNNNNIFTHVFNDIFINGFYQ